VKVPIGSAPSSSLNTSASGNASTQKSELRQRRLRSPTGIAQPCSRPRRQTCTGSRQNQGLTSAIGVGADERSSLTGTRNDANDPDRTLCRCATLMLPCGPHQFVGVCAAKAHRCRPWRLQTAGFLPGGRCSHVRSLCAAQRAAGHAFRVTERLVSADST
jgi:hypothetical protein